MRLSVVRVSVFFFQAEDGIRDDLVTGVQTCALPICVAAALDSSRLVTLMGPGGVGKTRLALDVAARVQSRFSGRAWWVELAPVARDDMAAQAIADAVGARDAPAWIWWSPLPRGSRSTPRSSS